jgi:hypothetical protein
MPLDEPLFEIDADRRVVTVPTVFSKNGVGVKGDHQAETLYFRIDRYFDHQDLFNVDDIIINWQFRPASSSRNADVPLHTSLAFAPDDTYDPGHVVFGWVIEKDMTPERGTLSFSIGFVKYAEDDTYYYALNTQTATVNINDALHLENPSILAGLSRPTFKRLANSRYTPENVTPLVDPEFISGDSRLAEDSDKTIYLGLPRVANFDLINGEEVDNLYLIAKAKTADLGVISYTWSGSRYDGEVVEPYLDELDTDEDAIYVPDKTKLDSNIEYFTKKSDGSTNFIKLSTLNETSTPTLDEVMDPEDSTWLIYMFGSSYAVQGAGSYSVDIQSSQTVAQEGTSIVQNSGVVHSQACLIPYAAIPSVVLSAEGAIQPTPKTNVVDTTAPHIFDEEEASQYTFIETGSAPVIKAMVTIDDNQELISARNEAIGATAISEDSSLGTIALQLVNENAQAPTAEVYENLTYVPHDPNGLVVNNEGTDAEGTYKVYAINRRNHTYSVSEPSNTITTSFVAPALNQISVYTLINGETTTVINNNVNPGDPEQPIVTLTPSADSATFTVTIGDTIPTGAVLTLRALEVDENGEHPKQIVDEMDHTDVIAISNEEGQPHTFTIVKDPGDYIVEAIVNYHGTERITRTASFRVGATTSWIVD